jgi:hypothetical protein
VDISFSIKDNSDSSESSDFPHPKRERRVLFERDVGSSRPNLLTSSEKTEFSKHKESTRIIVMIIPTMELPIRNFREQTGIASLATIVRILSV